MHNTHTTLYKLTRVVWYIFYVIEALLTLRFILELFGANPAAPFSQLIYSTSYYFVAPFLHVLNAPSANGSTLDLSVVLAMVVYYVVAWGIVKLIVMSRPVDHREARQQLEMEDQ